MRNGQKQSPFFRLMDFTRSHKGKYAALYHTLKGEEIMESIKRMFAYADKRKGKLWGSIIFASLSVLLLAHMIPEGIANILTPLLTIILLFIIDWRMALLTLAAAILYPVVKNREYP